MIEHQTTRRVWAILTIDPTLSLREIALCLGRDVCSGTVVRYHINKLRDAGFVKAAGYRRSRGRRVVMPCFLSIEATAELKQRIMMVKGVLTGKQGKQSAPKKTQELCGICRRPLKRHARCAGCGVLVGADHVFQSLTFGRCAACMRKRKAA